MWITGGKDASDNDLADGQDIVLTTQDVVLPTYQAAKTPYIISQTGSSAADYTNLFRIESVSHGDASNRDVKISFANIIKNFFSISIHN